jgi:hypothetical protein
MKKLLVLVVMAVGCGGAQPAETSKAGGSAGSAGSAAAAPEVAKKRWYDAEQTTKLRRQHSDDYAAFRAATCRTKAILPDSTELNGERALLDIASTSGELASCATRIADAGSGANATLDSDCGQRVQRAIAAAVRAKTSCSPATFILENDQPWLETSLRFAPAYQAYLTAMADVEVAMRAHFDGIIFGQEFGRGGSLLPRMQGIVQILKHGKAAMALAARLPATKLQKFSAEAAEILDREAHPQLMIMGELLTKPVRDPSMMAKIGHDESDAEPLWLETFAAMRAGLRKACPTDGTWKACFDALAAKGSGRHPKDAELRAADSPAQLIAAFSEQTLSPYAEYVHNAARAYVGLVALHAALVTRQLGHCPSADELKKAPFRDYAKPLGDTLVLEAKGKAVQITTPAWISTDVVSFDCK